MIDQTVGEPAGHEYALKLADDSYAWYRTAAIRSRRAYRGSEIAILALSAVIPVSAVIVPGSGLVPAILGGVIVVISGLRSIFHWHDNYLRFSAAREAVEAERRRYRTGTEPYDRATTRDQLLAAAVTRIEQDEMGQWVKVASAESKLGSTA